MKKNTRLIKLLTILLVIAAVFGILATSASAESFAAVNTRYIVIYHANNGTSEPTVSDTSYSTTFTARAADTFSSPGILFYFDGWSLTEDGEVAYEAGEVFTVSQQVTNLYAVWKFRSFQFMTYTVTYHANNGLGEGDVTDGPYFAGASVTTRDEETYTAPAGTEFAGWSLTSSGTVEYYAGEVFIMPGADVNLYGVWTTKPVLNRTDHLAYMQGYPDGTFGPTRNMTRAEAVVMFSRLLTKQMDISTTYTCTYTDVPTGLWYSNAIGYMQQHGVLSYTATTFRPNDAITRAEFADLAVSFENLTTGTINNFSDVPPGYWAYDQINYAVERGWLAGYPDGTFRPDNLITRAEVITVTNRVLERYPDYDYIDANYSIIKHYTDLSTAYWAYYNIIEASVGHDYTKVGTTETWLSLK